MFTKSEALKFISEKLEVADCEQRLQNDRRNLLDELSTNIQTKSLFQNLRLLQKAPKHRHRPSLVDIKADFVTGAGGVCYNLNTSTYFLLKAVGFKVSIALATCTTNVNAHNNHVVVYVEDVEKVGDRYIIDAAVGFPTFRAVSLDFERESPEFKDSFLEYKYIKYDGLIMRMHKETDPSKKQDHNSFEEMNFVIDGWKRFYYANVKCCSSLVELHPYFDKVFTDPNASPFHLSFRVIGFPGKKAVMVVNEKTLIENEEGELVATPIDGGDAGIVQTVRDHFPVLTEDLIRQALASWRQTM